MNREHRIRLLGPWDFELLDSQGIELWRSRINLKSFEPIQLDACDPANITRIVARRKFKRPTGLVESQSVYFETEFRDGLSLQDAFLNEQVVESSQEDSVKRLKLDTLQQSNLLVMNLERTKELEVSLPPFARSQLVIIE